MKTHGMSAWTGFATLAMCAAAVGQVEFYNGASRITDPDGCAEFCCLETYDPLQDYQEGGLTFDVDDFHFKFSACGIGNEHYYPNAGVFERISITHTDGSDFGTLEFQVSSGWSGSTIYVWMTAYLDGSPLDDYLVDVQCGDLVGVQGNFDEVKVGSYFDAVTRDQMNEGNMNAIAIDNACHTSDACLTMTVSNLIAGQQATWEVSGADPNARVAIIYGFQPGQTVVNGIQGYCATFGIRGVSPGKLICQKAADSNGNLRCALRIPGNVAGTRVLSQAAMRGTCPGECMSDVDDQVVQ